MALPDLPKILAASDLPDEPISPVSDVNVPTGMHPSDNVTSGSPLTKSGSGDVLGKPSKLTRDDVLKLARLAKLELTDDEVTKFTEELGAILGYVEQLESVDVEGLEPTYQVSGLKNVMRTDEVVNYGVSQAELLKNLPEQENGQIKVKRVLA